MLSVLACHSYFMRFDPKRMERGKPYPPLATLQVAALLRSAGHDVQLFDAMLAEGVPDFARKLQITRPQVVLLYEDNYNFLSKMCLGRMRAAACEMIALARKAGCRVIAAGSDASDSPDVYLKAGAEFALHGEGLAALLELMPRLDAAPRLDTAALVDGLAGIATSQNGAPVASAGDRLLPPPKFDGMPAWDLADLERYRAVWKQAHGYFSLNMVASRGCSFRCTWCAKPIWGNRYLQRNAGAIALEMAHLKRVFDVEHIWFADDIFGFRVDWVAQFASSLKALDGGLPFTIQTRADLVSEAMARELAQAGCAEAWIGAESGSQRVLDAMNKGTQVAEILSARERFRDVGVRVGFFIQLGYLNEDLSDILATRALLDSARPDDVGVSVSYPLPGTRFYELVKAELGSKRHWDDSGDLAMMFQGTYGTEFYRAVRHLLHEQVSLEKLSGPEHEHDYLRGRLGIDARWSELISNERQYRSVRDVATAVESAPAVASATLEPSLAGVAVAVS